MTALTGHEKTKKIKDAVWYVLSGKDSTLVLSKGLAMNAEDVEDLLKESELFLPPFNREASRKRLFSSMMSKNQTFLPPTFKTVSSAIHVSPVIGLNAFAFSTASFENLTTQLYMPISE